MLATTPIGVEYAITPLGQTLQTPFAAVYDWSIKHLDKIEAAQHVYDSRV